MKIELRDSQPLTENQIAEFEERFHVTLPKDYRRFVLTHNGARPTANIFPVSEDNHSGVNVFIPLQQIPEAIGYVYNVRGRFLPVAWAEGGNFVCIDLDAAGGVFFWDHELPADQMKLAKSFAEFLEILSPFDVNQVELRPGQVKSSWISPELLEGTGQE